ncbi:hypothetical protein [Chromobacterium vaccinii]|uniref:hypothetical protein n=1 Tax=Chromobacterium vaccinii TaxID=1108595 RepID=UPI0031DEE537
MTCQILLKLMTILGMCLVGAGTVLLWRGSPGGYAGGAYIGVPQQPVDAQNKKMAIQQRVAIALIVVGTLFQFPAVIYG